VEGGGELIVIVWNVLRSVPCVGVSDGISGLLLGVRSVGLRVCVDLILGPSVLVVRLDLFSWRETGSG
jgi:hypothetical protein